MKKNILRPGLFAVGVFMLLKGQAQVSTPFNNPTLPGTDFVGWDNTTAVPLMVRHDANQPIDWYTNAIQRVRLNPNLTGGLGQFGGINRDGFMLISGTADAFTNAGSRAPFTRLHLVDEAVDPTQPNVYAQQLGFRPWQRNGVTFTGNSDQGYVGQKYAGDDNTDLVVQWSDNPETQPWGCDRMKFVFSSTYIAGTPRGMNSYDGMEAMRFWPKSGTEVNVGIGDFAPPAIGDPTERLDILDGTCAYVRCLMQATKQRDRSSTWWSMTAR